MIRRNFNMFIGLFIAALIAFMSLFVVSVLSTQAQDYKTPAELADPNGKFADVDGVSLYYVSEGSPNNPAVILIHGFGGSTFTWRYALPALAEAGFYAVALDLPPFGLSDKNVELPYSRSWMADRVAGLMDELGIEAATIVGHSMGGMVTAQFAVRHPERVTNLVFVAGGIFDERGAVADDEQQPADNSNSPLALLTRIDPKAPAAALLLRSLVTERFFVDTIRTAYHDPNQVTDEVAAGYARLLQIEEAPIGFLAYVQAQETSPITLADLTAVATMPTLIMWGREDTWVQIAVGEAMRDSLSNVTWVTYPQVGHLPMEENSVAFNADLVAFLQANLP